MVGGAGGGGGGGWEGGEGGRGGGGKVEARFAALPFRVEGLGVEGLGFRA